MPPPLFGRRRPPPRGHAPKFPDWVLLDTVVRGANYDWKKMSIAQSSACLATTARTFVDVTREAESQEEVVVEVEVSFFFVSPPEVSGFIVHVGDNGLAYGATVVSTDGDAVLLAIDMAKFSVERYLVYKAGRGNPSLEVLPYPPKREFHPIQEVGILSQGEGFVVAALIPKFKIGCIDYELILYSSQTKKWSTKVIPLDSSRASDLGHVLIHRTAKIITVGGDSLGWVDLWHGITFCNVLDENPVVRILNFPCPMPLNEINFGISSPRPFRDVICIDKTLKFVEVEYNQDADDDPVHDYTSWKAKFETMILDSDSDSDWTPCFTVETGDILLTGKKWHMLKHRLWDDDRLSLSKFQCFAPTLGIDFDNLYMMTRPLGTNEKPLGLFAALHMGNKKMRLVSFSTERMTYIDPNYCPCTVSRYFNNTSVAGKFLIRENLVGENLRWIGLVKLAVLRDILVAIKRLTSLDAILMKLERPDEEQLRTCSASVEMLGKMAYGIISYTDHEPATSLQYHVKALQEDFSIVARTAFPVIGNVGYKGMVGMMHMKISSVIEVAHRLVKALLPKRLDDPQYSLRSMERTLLHGKLPLTQYLRRLAPS